MSGDRREKQTLIPAFDPASLAKELEAEADRPTITPPYDALSYARILDNHVEGKSSDGRDTPRTMTAATPALRGGMSEPPLDTDSTVTIGRAMYGSYLQSDYPEAMVLAERVLEREPDHALAKLVIEGCRERLGPLSEVPRLVPSSVLRLKRPAHEIADLVEDTDTAAQTVLDLVDGVADVATLAELTGIKRSEVLDRMHALVELGLLEVVNG